MLDPELSKLLNQESQRYRSTLEDSNPAPPDGVYLQLLTKVHVRTGKDFQTQRPVAIVDLHLRVVGDVNIAGETVSDYKWRLSCKTSSESGQRMLGRFVRAAGLPGGNLIKDVEGLAKLANEVAFSTAVSRYSFQGRQMADVEVQGMRRVGEAPGQTEAEAAPPSETVIDTDEIPY